LYGGPTSGEHGLDNTSRFQQPVRASQDVVLDTLEVSFEGIGGMIRVNNIEVTNRFDARGLDVCDEFE